MEYNVDYFIGKFSAIPEERWNASVQMEGDVENGTRCAFGLCMPLTKNEYLKAVEVCGDNQFGHMTPEGIALNGIFTDAGYHGGSGNWITDVNNGRSKDYPQSTPKQRILAALEDIKRIQEKRVKEKIVYVTVPETIKEQVEELILS